MKKHLPEIIVTLVSAVFSVILVIVLVFGISDLPVPEKTVLPDEAGREISGVCISELKEKNYLKYAYYTPDEFLSASPHEITGEEVDLTSQKNIAQKGTYYFIFYHLNPEDETFAEKKQALEPYIESDNNCHFALYLPPCFSASCVYVRSVLVAEAGEISGYDYIEFSDKQGKNEEHKTATEPYILDLSFYMRRSTLTNDFNRRALVVTVHYESDSGKIGFDGIPMIGSKDAISGTISADKTFLTTVAIFAFLVFAILTFACILKKSLFAVPQAALAFGVSGFTFCKLLTYSQNSLPYFLSFGIPVCASVILAAAALSVFYSVKERKPEFLIAPPIAIVFGICYLALPFSAPVVPCPVMWLSVLILGLTTFSAFAFFADLERRNVFLTNNLKSEVARQTEDLKAIIDERDRLLRYLSHDMKKPVTSIKHFVTEIRKNETDEENIKALDIIDGKLEALRSDFVELQKFARLNFAAEASATVYTDEICESLYLRLSPDCEANGITLKVSSPKIAVYAKRTLLCSVLDNLVFNAVEHSKCKNITVSATRTSSGCKITVTDDGTGLGDAHDVFEPYRSDHEVGDNLGLGLYISKQHVASMGGDLTYSRENGKSVFTVTLQLS